MNLYLVSQDVNNYYDTFDSFVCAAHNEDDARNMHPGKYTYDDTWCKPEFVEVKLIGTASQEYTESQVICASFNAG